MNQRHERRVAIIGRCAAGITLVYTTLGLGSQAFRIISTGETPSLIMMILAGLAFASWVVWGSVKQPREINVIVPNFLGFCFCVLIIVLIVWNSGVSTREAHGSKVESTTR